MVVPLTRDFQLDRCWLLNMPSYGFLNPRTFSVCAQEIVVFVVLVVIEASATLPASARPIMYRICS